MDNNLNQIEMFSCPLWTGQLQDHESYQNNLIEVLDDISYTSANRNKENYNVFETNRDLHTHPAFADFIKNIGPYGKELLDIWGLEEASSLGVSSMWGSISERHGVILPHSIPFCMLYGLYFIKTPPESGFLELKYPTNDQNYFSNFLFLLIVHHYYFVQFLVFQYYYFV